MPTPPSPRRLSPWTAAPDAGPLYPAMLLCALALAVASALFVLAPGIDLAISALFYAPGTGFVGTRGPVVVIRNIGIAITWVVCIGLAVVALWWRLKPEAVARWPSAHPWADWLFVTAAMALGPGALVNLVFKPIWGRARPRQVIEFGGKQIFTPAWTITDQCSWGCSFVSGEAAASAFIVAFAFIAPPRWRVPALIAGVLVTLAVSFARVAAGGHFLSDVVIAWLLILLLLLILHAQIYHGRMLGPFKHWHSGD
jgi:lipid A 4'-phosphatase